MVEAASLGRIEMSIETPSRNARDYFDSKTGVKITVHKSVRNNWKTTEHRDGQPSVVTCHENRKAAIEYAKSVK
jgi:hypothetical protein